MSDTDRRVPDSEPVQLKPRAEGLRFGRGVPTGRVLTVLICSMIGGAIALAVVYAIL